MLTMNLLLFGFGCFILWKAAGLVMKGVERFSHNLKLSSFATSFLILGILTSLSEISVGINAVLEKKPEVFVGNLIGASFVILLFIIPLLAIFNQGIILRNHLGPQRLFFFLVLIASPSFMILDGVVSRYDAVFVLLLYALFFYLFQKNEGVGDKINLQKLDNKTVLKNLGLIIFGAVLIFIASKILVDKTVYFADMMNIPSFLVSLLILSIGTNLPELVIAVNSIRAKKSDIAFGDYVGSAAANSLLFGILTLVYGPFNLEAKGFNVTFLIIMVGYILFFLFARSKNRISSSEGIILLMLYIFFLLTQATEIFMLSPKV